MDAVGEGRVGQGSGGEQVGDCERGLQRVPLVPRHGTRNV